MRVTTLTPNLIQLTRIRFVNAYLVREDDGFTLVDTTTAGAAKDLIAAAENAGAPIVRVALTHGHGDHVGSLDELRAALGEDAKVLMGELDARIHAGEQVVDGKLPGSWSKLATKPDVLLKAGDRIGSLEVVASPGHTPGHVAFLDTRDGSLIAGDVFAAIGPLAVTCHYRTRFPLATMGTWDRAKDLESATALVALDPALLVVGHGPATRSPKAAMETAVARARRALG
ncbi:MAG TPA: MBL fold metallo-hydrolase [Solirubrobacteraceae bacterium]|jgi:glyoxylase-like metal-dependent hydrolase (beta-lactamase superfamily II)